MNKSQFLKEWRSIEDSRLKKKYQKLAHQFLAEEAFGKIKKLTCTGCVDIKTCKIKGAPHNRCSHYTRKNVLKVSKKKKL